MKGAGRSRTVAEADRTDSSVNPAKTSRHERACDNRQHRAKMADHREQTVARASSVHISVASAHGAESRAHVGAGAVEECLAESQTSRLIPNQRRKDVALSQRESRGGAERLLAAAQEYASRDFPATIEAGDFVVSDSRQQHPAVGRQEIGLRFGRSGCAGGWSRAGLNHA